MRTGMKRSSMTTGTAMMGTISTTTTRRFWLKRIVTCIDMKDCFMLILTTQTFIIDTSTNVYGGVVAGRKKKGGLLKRSTGGKEKPTKKKEEKPKEKSLFLAWA